MLRQALRVVGGTAAAVTGGWAVRALHGVPDALGANPARIATVAGGSPNYRDGVFHNREPSSTLSITRADMWKVAHDMFGGTDHAVPAQIPVLAPDPSVPAADLAVTWYGHSSALIELDGYRILTDPVWSERCSPGVPSSAFRGACMVEVLKASLPRPPLPPRAAQISSPSAARSFRTRPCSASWMIVPTGT
ncbi:MAG TPA: MBL fold metallo-hydrolase, partial [Mycolicibacterium fallax]|nr:MBL fold metallo-hydrolase [Mycolicibacterium fallax]